MTKQIKTTSQLLFNEEPLVINRMAARVLGLNESIVLQQIHYWIEINRKAKINFHEGRTWTYNTYDSWQNENFDFWSERTLKRIFKNLFDKGILLKGNYNKHKYDRKLWVTIDYDELDNILNEYNNKIQGNVEISTKCQNDIMSDSNIVPKCHYGKCQNVTMESAKMSPPIAETNTEINTETSLATQSEDKPLVVDKNELVDLIESKTHLLLDSKNKKDKVSKWNKDRLLKAIEIFIEREGQYFTLLEKIYKDDKNFAPTGNGSVGTVRKTSYHNINESFRDYTPAELKNQIKENQSKFETKKETKVKIDKNELRERAINILQEKINADETRLFKPIVKDSMEMFEHEINEIYNQLLDDINE